MQFAEDAPETVAEVGNPCSKAGALGCSQTSKKLQLLCDGTKWVSNGVCPGDLVCDPGPGEKAGSCQPPGSVDASSDSSRDATVDGDAATDGTADSTVVDTAKADTGTADTGLTDTGTADTGTPDTGTTDTGVADTGFPDFGTDTGKSEGGFGPGFGPPCSVDSDCEGDLCCSPIGQCGFRFGGECLSY